MQELADARVAARRAATLMRGRRSLVVSDFDGTLSRLVDDPWSASIVPAARRALRRLAARDGVDVVLLSGRTVSDLAARARVGGAAYLGDHGSQRAMARRGFRHAALQVEHAPVEPGVIDVVRRLVAEVPQAVPEPWLVVEDKTASVTFHFRTALDMDEARARVLAASERVDRAGLLVRSGSRRSVELRAPDASDKGRALRGLIELRRPEAVIMLGDDRTDALAFEVLREAREAGVLEGLAIAVAGRPDALEAVVLSADLVLGSAVEAARFLGRLAAGRPS